MDSLSILAYWFCATNLSLCSVKVITVGCCPGTKLSWMPWVRHFSIVLPGLVKVPVLLRSIYNTGAHKRDLPALRASGSGAAVSLRDWPCT